MAASPPRSRPKARTIIIDGKKIPFYSTKDPKGVNWGTHGVDVLLEYTGATTTKARPRPARPGRQARADLRPGR